MFASPGIIAHELRGPVLAALLLTGLMAASPSTSAATIGISGSTLIAGAEPGDGPMALTVSVSAPARTWYWTASISPS